MTFLRNTLFNRGLVLTSAGAKNVPLDETPPPTGDITVVVVASRITGPAPLAVKFHALGTTTEISGVTDTYRQLLYTFGYGETGLGNWSISGKSKNEDIGGPLGAHVFETPGTYVVRCTASRGGSSHYDEVTITVTDPNTVYAGTNTVFISPSANYAGAPSGAETRTTVPTIVSNKRYLFRPGESFGSLTIPHGVVNTQAMAAPGIGGAKPALSSLAIGEGAGPPNANFPNDITVSGFQVSGGITQYTAMSKLLLMRLTQPSGFEYAVGADLDYYADPARYGLTMPYPEEVFVVDCNSVGDSTEQGFIGFMYDGAMLGCDFKGSNQHTVRVFAAVQFFQAHNDLSGPSSENIRHSLKLHSAGANHYTLGGDHSDNANHASRQCVIADNVMSDTDNNQEFTLVLGPQGTAFSEGLEDMIVENNRFKRGSGWVSDIQLAGRRMTSINNTQFTGGGAANVAAPGIHNEGLPDSSWEGPYYTSRT